MGEAESYENVTIQYIAGRRAILTIYHNGMVQEQVELGPIKTRTKLHELFMNKGFQPKPPQEREQFLANRKAEHDAEAKLKRQRTRERLQQQKQQQQQKFHQPTVVQQRFAWEQQQQQEKERAKRSSQREEQDNPAQQQQEQQQLAAAGVGEL
jgi:hypothetical protein